MAEGFYNEQKKQAHVHTSSDYCDTATRVTPAQEHVESKNVDNASLPPAGKLQCSVVKLVSSEGNTESNAQGYKVSTEKISRPSESRTGKVKSGETEEEICYAQTVRLGIKVHSPPSICSSDIRVKADCKTENNPPGPPKHDGTHRECSENLCDLKSEIYEANGLVDLKTTPEDFEADPCFISDHTNAKPTKDVFYDANFSPELELHEGEKFYDALENLGPDETGDQSSHLPDIARLGQERKSTDGNIFKWEISPKHTKVSVFDKKLRVPVLPNLESRKVFHNDVTVRPRPMINFNNVQISWDASKVPMRHEVIIFKGKTGQEHRDISIDDTKLRVPHSVRVISIFTPLKPVNDFNEIPDNIEVDISRRDLLTLYSHFAISAPLYISHHNPRHIYRGNTWRDIDRKIKCYAMIKRHKKLKRKKVFTAEAIDSKILAQDNVLEATHETYYTMFKEGPAEILLTQPPDNNKCKESQGNKCKRQPRHVEADGIISDLASDPPGQQSLYIPPGDNRRESYRLSTFEQFPSRIVNAANLAKRGFVYTGFYDRVKCFSCGRTVEKWEQTDNPADRKWHKTDCSFARGIPTGNIPIGSFFGQSFANSFRSTNTQQPMEVAPSYTSQIMNGPVMRIPTDVPGTASTFQIQPGSSVVIGSSNQPARQNPPPSRFPVTSHPANPPASAPRRGWRMANVISADHKRHLTNLYLNRELDRLASFGRWPTGRRNVSPVALARAGFFYLGDMDRTQCFSCGGVLRNWSYEDDAMEEHRTHFANCRFVVGTERRNVPIPDRPETPQELADKFPCRFPMNPHMRSEASRVDTFDRRWPASRIRAKPHEIAEAGFFFLGERDRVKCWYCNGGLQNWEYDDIPWVEHSKWFPNCQFLLQKQGQLFVYRHLSLNPHLPRPIIGRQDGSTIDPVVTPLVGQSARVQDIPPSEPRARAPSPPPAIIDPQEEIRKRQERVEREMQNSETVKFVLLMGYAADIVRRVLKEKLESGTPFEIDNIFEGTAALLDAVMKMEEEIEKEKQEEQATNIKFPTVSQNHGASAMESMETAPSMGHTSGVFEVSGFSHDSDDEERDLYGSISENPTNRLSAGAVGLSTNGPVSGGFRGALANGPMSLGTETRSRLLGAPEDTESLKEFIEQKKEEQLCKICFTENADMVFIPCSHMVCCKTCTEAIRQCPVCRTKIEKAIKTYLQ